MIELKFGNRKLPTTTMVYDMGTSRDCPSKALGLCKVVNEYGENGCYAAGPEKFRPNCLPCRERKQEYWLNHSAKDIYQDIDKQLKRKRTKTKLFRFNEVGDFWSKACVDKLSYIASLLKIDHKVITYGYSARADLDFGNVEFKVKSSGWENGNNGKTVVIHKDNKKRIDELLALGWKICPGNCKVCSLCAGPGNIIFIKH